MYFFLSLIRILENISKAKIALACGLFIEVCAGNKGSLSKPVSLQSNLNPTALN
jgi:hypothetical protein